MKKLFILLALICATLPGWAQTGVVTVSGTSIADATGTNKLSSGTIYFSPIGANGQPIAFHVSGHGQATSRPVSTAVTAGAFTITLADTNLTSPVNVGYQVTVYDSSNNQIIGPGVGYVINPAYSNTWCTAGVCNFDNYNPNTPPGVATTAPGISGVTVNTLSAGSSASGSVSGTYPNYALTFNIPTGPTGATGPAGPPMTFLGGWSSSLTYAAGQAVSYTVGGIITSYVSLVSANLNNEPDTSPAEWGILAQGVAGATGATGPQGPAGGGASLTVANSWTLAQSFNTPFIVNPSSAPGSVANYSTLNGSNLASTSALNQGVLVYGASGSQAGLDFGNVSGLGFGPRIFAPSTYTITNCFYTSGTAPTAQSSFNNCPWQVSNTTLKGLLPLTVIGQGTFSPASAPATAASYSSVNGGNLASPTNLNQGLMVYSAAGEMDGIDFGNENGLNAFYSYGTRIFAADNHFIYHCFYTHGTTPTAQSSFVVCPIVVSPTQITDSQTHIFNGTIPLQLGFPNAGVTSISANYARFNANGAISTTNLNAGFTLYSAVGFESGMDFGWGNAGPTGYYLRLFAPSNQAIAQCFFPSGGSSPNAQSSFTVCPFYSAASGIQGGAGVVVNGNMNLNGKALAGYGQGFFGSDPQATNQVVSSVFAQMQSKTKTAGTRYASYGSVYHSYGDSVTAGTGATSCTGTGTCYAGLVNTALGATLTNNGVSGAQACDNAEKVFNNENPGASGNPVYSDMIGTNDANVNGAGAYEATYKLCHQAAIFWLATQSGSKVAGNNGAVTTTGTWTADTTYSQVSGLVSTTNASQATFPITSYGQPLYIWYRIINGSGGTFTYQVDTRGTVAVTTAPPAAISQQLGSTIGIGFARITNVAPGSHTIKFTVTSATGAGNQVAILAIGTAQRNAYYVGPVVAVGTVIYQYQDAASAATSAYSIDAMNDEQMAQADGLDVRLVDVRFQLHNGASTEMVGSGNLHPNDTGHTEIANAFIPVLQAPPAASVNRWTPTSSAQGCTASETWTDGSYVYACTTSGTITRVATSSF